MRNPNTINFPYFSLLPLPYHREKITPIKKKSQFLSNVSVLDCWKTLELAVIATGGVCLAKWTEAEKEKMELSPKLSLGFMNIALFMEGLIYYQSTCLEFKYRDGKVLGTQPHPIRGSASTHCVLYFNLISILLF